MLRMSEAKNSIMRKGKRLMDVSVIVPMYHGRQYVPAILEQIRRNAERASDAEIELLLYNDCPEEDIRTDAKTYGFTLKVINAEKNAGIHGARVNALKQAAGDYILFLDQDDVISDDYLESQRQKIGGADAVVCRLVNGRRQHYTDTFRFEEVVTKEFMLNHWCPIVSPGQVLLRKAAVPNVWKENILKNNGADDYFLWLSMMAEGKKFALNQEVLFEHVITGSNTSEDVNRMMDSEQEMLHILKENHVFSEEDEKYLQKLPDSLRKIHVKLLGQYKDACAVYHAGMDVMSGKAAFCEALQRLNQVAVYGAGVVGQSLFRVLRLNGIEPAFYIDRNAEYITQDVPVYTIDDAPCEMEGIIISINTENGEIEECLKKKYGADVKILNALRLFSRDEKNG